MYSSPPVSHSAQCERCKCIHRASYNSLTVRSDLSVGLSACSYCQINSCSSENEMCKICGTTVWAAGRKPTTNSHRLKQKHKEEEEALPQTYGPCSGQKPFLYGFHFLCGVVPHSRSCCCSLVDCSCRWVAATLPCPKLQTQFRLPLLRFSALINCLWICICRGSRPPFVCRCCLLQTQKNTKKKTE